MVRCAFLCSTRSIEQAKKTTKNADNLLGNAKQNCSKKKTLSRNIFKRKQLLFVGCENGEQNLHDCKRNNEQKNKLNQKAR